MFPNAQRKLPKADTTTIEMTFAPVDKLIDGWDGKTLTLRAEGLQVVKTFVTK